MTTKNLLSLGLGLASLLFSAAAAPKDRFAEPPKVYVDEGACPGECCVFRRWSVLKDATLYDKPDGTRAIGSVKKGEWVKGLTGTVFIPPTRLKVVHDHVSDYGPDPRLSYHVGDIFYMLTPMGEGFRKIWFQGKLVPAGDEISHLDCTKGDKLRCPRPSKECWALPDGPCREHEMVWWVKVRTKNGIEGWVKEISGNDQSYDDPHFGNRDSCGG